MIANGAWLYFILVGVGFAALLLFVLFIYSTNPKVKFISACGLVYLLSMLLIMSFTAQSSVQPTILYEGEYLTSEEISQHLQDQLNQENPDRDIWVEIHF